MGKVFTIWSAFSSTGKTILAYNLLGKIINEAGAQNKVLVISSGDEHSNLLELFNIKKVDISMEEMVNFKIASTNTFYGAITKRGSVFFTKHEKPSDRFLIKNLSRYKNIYSELKEIFDLIVIDLSSEKQSVLNNLIIELSDSVINVLPQDKAFLGATSFTTNKDIIFVVNKYSSIYPSTKEIESLYKLDKAVYSLPYCNQLQEHKNKDSLHDYLYKQTSFNEDLENLWGYLKELLFEDEEQNALGVYEKKSVFKVFLNNIFGEAYEQ